MMMASDLVERLRVGAQMVRQEGAWSPHAHELDNAADRIEQLEAALRGPNDSGERLRLVRPMGAPGSYQRGFDNGWNAAVTASRNHPISSPESREKPSLD